jgi:ATP-dependent RNA helicase DDX42
MAGIEKEVKKDTRKEEVEVPKKETEKGVRGDIDNEDDEESYYRLTFIKYWLSFFVKIHSV